MKQYITLLFTCISLFASAQVYFVGHASVNFKDAARTGGYSINGGTAFPTGGTGRNIGTEIYYPATSAGDNTPFAAGQFPVVVFGHGFAMGWDSYKTLTDSLVKNGYIVALPRTEGSLLPAPSHLDFGKDLAKVAQLMLTANTTTGNFFNAKLNGRQAIGGHSMGGGATFLSDPFTSSNVMCYFTFAAAETNPSAVAAAGLATKPHLVFSGTYDCVAPPAQHQDLMYTALTSTCKTKIALTRAYHCAFADNNFNCGFGEGTCITQGGLSSANQQLLVRRYLNPYLDYYLKGVCPAWTKFEDLTDTTTVGVITQTCNNLVPENAGIVGDTSFCVGTSTTFTAQPTGFSYVWSDNSTADSLSITQAGTYTLTVGNGVCTLPAVSKVTSVLPLPGTPTVISTSDTTCAESNLILSSTSVNSNYYVWSVPQGWLIVQGDSTATINVTTGESNGVISVSAANECGVSDTASQYITIVARLAVIDSIIGARVVCPSATEMYTVNTVPTTDYYVWTFDGNSDTTNTPANSIQFGNTGGTITVTTTSNVCQESRTVVMGVVMDSIALQVSQSGNMLYATYEDDYAYQWLFNDSLISGETDSACSVTANGVYTVIVTNENGCQNSRQINVTGTGIDNVDGSMVKVYPNPVKRGDVLNVVANTNDSLKLFDAMGRLVYQTLTTNSNTGINTINLSAGLYHIVIGDKASKVIVE